MNKFQSTPPHGFDKKVSKTAVTQSEGKKHVNVSETKVFDTSLFSHGSLDCKLALVIE